MNVRPSVLNQTVKTYPRVCRNGHTVTGSQDECSDGRCARCKRETQARYAATPQGQARAVRYEETAKRQQFRRAAEVRYKATPKGKAVTVRAAAKYAASAKGRAAMARYKVTDKGRATFARGHARYRASPKGRAASCRHTQKRKALKLNLGSDGHSRAEVWERDGGVCQMCGIVLDPKHWHEDHIVPLALGGPDTLANVQASCPPCNLRKGHRVA